MAFHEVRFPPNLSFGSLGGPQRRTDIVTLANGFEERNTPWAHSRHTYDAGLGMRSIDDLQLLIDFFEARGGQLHGFRWKDWADYRSCAASSSIEAMDQEIGTGDGSRSVFQLTKTYRSGSESYVRFIRKPVAGTVTVAVGGVALEEGSDFSIAHETGEVSFAAAPAPGAMISAGYEFDVPVRFDTDRILTSIESFRAGQAPSVPVIEVRI
ncbi:MAG: DUF2460 domain-containing protein [Pseudomonadota bacterium]